MAANAVHPEKVAYSIVLIPTGSMTAVKALQPEKAELPMLARLFGKRMDSIDLQFWYI